MDAQLKTHAGMIRHGDLLNVLLAIWKMEYASMAQHPNGFTKSHLAGVEEALQAVAQVTGLGEVFNADKANHEQVTLWTIDMEKILMNRQGNPDQRGRGIIDGI